MNNVERQKSVRSGVLICLCLLGWIVVYSGNFWISDDAYISLRTAENFIAGYGLRYNVVERVQAFTHPLWLFYLIVGVLVFPDPEWAIFWMSLALSIVSLLILLCAAKDTRTRVLVFLLVGSSQAFVQYASSGLENPLGYVCITTLFYCMLRLQSARLSGSTVLLYLLLSSFACTARLDYSLLFFPSALLLLWRWWEQKRSVLSCISIALAAGVPLFGWHFFSLIYYGYVFPNTYYSKMSGAIPLVLRLEQGLAYISYSLVHDTATMFVIASLALVMYRKRSIELFSCCAGIFLYCVYVVWMGGDFMQGRFFAVPFVGALLLNIPHIQENAKAHGYWIILSLLVCYNLVHPQAPWKIGYVVKPALRLTKVENEQAAYYEYSNPFFGNSQSYELQASFTGNQEHQCVVHLKIGRLGYHLGPTVYIIDPIGLTDPLLSRLPIDSVPFLHHGFRAGHIIRRLPRGYIDSCVSGENKLYAPELAAYFEVVRSITRDDLFDVTRWEYITKALFEGPTKFSETYDGYSIHIPIRANIKNSCEVPLDYYGEKKKEARIELSQVQSASTCSWILK